jgi:diketogulonate reductase-like aldo/keto reductase
MKRLGGKVIDSSPMYGSSESVVGMLAQALSLGDDFFYASKVWTSGKEAGITQMHSSAQKMKRQAMDLMQVHNLLDWQIHVKTLKAWKDEGKLRYWGLTHYVDSSHDTLKKIIEKERPDFVQFNYSIQSRNAEKSLLAAAQQYGTAVLINQPFESGQLFRKVKGKPLPDWAADQDITSWGNYFLKFILAQEAVTCVIPGTANPKHLVDNMGAGYGKLPDAAVTKRMADYLRTL